MKSMISIRFYVIRPLCRPVRSVVRPVFVRPVFTRSIVQSVVRPLCRLLSAPYPHRLGELARHHQSMLPCLCSRPVKLHCLGEFSCHHQSTCSRLVIRAPCSHPRRSHCQFVIHGPPLLFLFFLAYAPELLPHNHPGFHIRTKLGDLALEREVL